MQWVYPVFWLVLMIVFLVAEAATVQMVSIWLAAGSLAAIIPALFGMPLPVQLIAFLLVSGACLIFTRPFVKKVLAVKKTSTNADRTIGEIGLVTETVDNAMESGRIMVDGLSWKAKTADGAVIEPGSRVMVKAMEGVTLTVEKIV